jgi:hypothetical protein
LAVAGAQGSLGVAEGEFAAIGEGKNILHDNSLGQLIKNIQPLGLIAL